MFCSIVSCESNLFFYEKEIRLQHLLFAQNVKMRLQALYWNLPRWTPRHVGTSSITWPSFPAKTGKFIIDTLPHPLPHSVAGTWATTVPVCFSGSAKNFARLNPRLGIVVHFSAQLGLWESTAKCGILEFSQMHEDWTPVLFTLSVVE